MKSATCGCRVVKVGFCGTEARRPREHAASRSGRQTIASGYDSRFSGKAKRSAKSMRGLCAVRGACSSTAAMLLRDKLNKRIASLQGRALPLIFFLVFAGPVVAQFPAELRTGRANHAFDHLGNVGGQADTAAACGATIIYTGGLGDAGYHGLPPKSQFDALCEKVRAYNEHAKSIGIEIPIGYLCATSIVKLETFDKNWTADFRAQFKTRPGEWRQQDRHGKPLPSWYGGDYAPACMNNPDWRAYERAMVRYTLETGHGGVFFDNPTVHPEGCYCPNCMKIFAEFVQARPAKEYALEDAKNVSAIRKFARRERSLFRQFRATIARDFLADMRVYADKIKPHALITCNNSLNDPSVF